MYQVLNTSGAAADASNRRESVDCVFAGMRCNPFPLPAARPSHAVRETAECSADHTSIHCKWTSILVINTSRLPTSSARSPRHLSRSPFALFRPVFFSGHCGYRLPPPALRPPVRFISRSADRFPSHPPPIRQLACGGTSVIFSRPPTPPLASCAGFRLRICM
jgi:hypothetical protein